MRARSGLPPLGLLERVSEWVPHVAGCIPRGCFGRGHGAAAARIRSGLVAAAAALSAAGCGPQEAEVVDRETFVETYVALRAAELTSPGAVIPDEARDSVLAEMGVSEAELVAFAEAHGDDVVFMEAVWTDVQNRLTELSSGPDEVR